MGEVRADDLENIVLLTHRYARGLDRFDLPETLDVFSPDAVLDTSAFGMGLQRGREEIGGYLAGIQGRMAHQAHFVSNRVVEFSGPDEASGTHYVDVRAVDREGGRITATAFNEDRYVRTADGWRIARRVVGELMPMHREAPAAGA